MTSEFLGIVVQLVQLGAIGLAAVLLVAVFLIVAKGGKVDPATSRLRHSFLRYGVLCVLAFGLLDLAQFWLAGQRAVSEHKVSLTFSPDFEVNELPLPRIQLPDGPVAPSTQFPVARDMQIVVSVEAALKRVRDLKQATEAVIRESTEIQERLRAVTPAAPSAAWTTLNTDVRNSIARNSQLLDALEQNRFDDVSRITRQLNPQ